MPRKAKNLVTDDSKRIIDMCKELVKLSGIGIPEFLEKAKIGNNYWYMRMRYEAPLNTSDIENIARVLNLTSLEIYERALVDSKIKYYEPPEESVSSELQHYSVDDFEQLDADIEEAKQAYTAAASYDPNKEIERETPQD